MAFPLLLFSPEHLPLYINEPAKQHKSLRQRLNELAAEYVKETAGKFYVFTMYENDKRYIAI